MSRRLREHHRNLREAEVWIKDVPQRGRFRVALVYPNLYYVGMSNLGFQCVFEMLNAQPDVLCERAFLPDDIHTEELEQSGSPLVTLDSATPASRLRHGRVLGQLRERLPARAQGPSPGRHSAPREGPRPTGIPWWSWAGPPSS